jgi:RNA polymerase sigma factor (sigma-70 family)
MRVDKFGHVLGARYSDAIDGLQAGLWQSFPQVADTTDRDTVVDETLRRASDFEAKHGAAEDLPSLIRHIFEQVVVSLFRTKYYTLHEKSVASWDLGALRAKECSPEAVEAAIYARQLLDSLDSTKKMIVLLRYQGFEIHEIAAHMGLSRENVYQALSRARAKLRDRATRAADLKRNGTESGRRK